MRYFVLAGKLNTFSNECGIFWKTGQPGEKFMKSLQKPMFTHYLIAKLSKLLNEQLKFGPITRSLLNMWYYSGQGSQRTTRVMLVLSVWFLTSYYVQNSYLLKCSLGYSTSFLEVFERAILTFFCIRSSTSMADGKVCFKRDSWQIWFRTEDFSI